MKKIVLVLLGVLFLGKNVSADGVAIPEVRVAHDDFATLNKLSKQFEEDRKYALEHLKIINESVAIMNRGFAEKKSSAQIETDVRELMASRATQINDINRHFSTSETIAKEWGNVALELQRKCGACDKGELRASLVAYVSLKKIPECFLQDVLVAYLGLKPTVTFYTAKFQLSEQEIPVDLATFIKEMDETVGKVIEKCTAVLPDFEKIFSRDEARLLYEKIHEMSASLLAQMEKRLTQAKDAITTPAGGVNFNIDVNIELMQMVARLVADESCDVRKKALLNLWHSAARRYVERFSELSKIDINTFASKEAALDALKQLLDVLDQEFVKVLAKAYGVNECVVTGASQQATFPVPAGCAKVVPCAA